MKVDTYRCARRRNEKIAPVREGISGVLGFDEPMVITEDFDYTSIRLSCLWTLLPATRVAIESAREGKLCYSFLDHHRFQVA